MASFAYIKELFEKKDKNGNGYLDLLVIGSDKKEYPAKVWQFDNNGQFEKDDVVEINCSLLLLSDCFGNTYCSRSYNCFASVWLL